MLGSSLTVRDLYIASKVGGDGKGANVLDSRNPHLLNCLRAFFEGKPVARLYASPSEKDILLIAQRLMDAFARIEIRQPDIAQRCVEFCEDDDYVLSDDTNAIAFGYAIQPSYACSRFAVRQTLYETTAAVTYATL